MELVLSCVLLLVSGLLISFDHSANALTRRRFSVNFTGPVARFEGITACPGNGAVSNAPKRVLTTVGRDRSVLRTSGQRRYDGSVLRRLAVIQRAQQTGFTLDEIKQLFFGF